VLEVLPAQLPWWVAGPAIGLTVAVLYAVGNLRMGVSGAWVQLMLVVRRRPATEPWRVVFLVGLVGGAGLAGLLGDVRLHGIGPLDDLLPWPVLVVVLVAAGLAIGYGARWARGCTSGHGLAGCAAGSPGSLLATSVFFGAGVAITWALHLLTGGAW